MKICNDSTRYISLHAIEFEHDQQAKDAVTKSEMGSEMCTLMDPRRLQICRWWVARAASVAYLNIGALTWGASETILHVLIALTDAKY